MALVEIPLTSTNEQFSVELNGTQWVIRARWIDGGNGGWVLDWFDENETPVLLNMPVVTGADLSQGFEYLGLPSPLYCLGINDLTPDIDNLGVSHFLILDAQ